jgi:hypothetical protein
VQWAGKSRPAHFYLIVSIESPPGLVDGCEAFGFAAFVAFGLRISLLDFFCDFAMRPSFTGGMPIGAH